LIGLLLWLLAGSAALLLVAMQATQTHGAGVAAVARGIATVQGGRGGGCRWEIDKLSGNPINSKNWSIYQSNIKGKSKSN